MNYTELYLFLLGILVGVTGCISVQGWLKSRRRYEDSYEQARRHVVMPPFKR